MFHVKHDVDVVVVGGGHAGCEAAAAATRAGARVVLVTMKKADLGTMSCNPAIGGLGKGHLVREIDALDGLMGRVADMSGIQFRLLNRKKGPAVQGPRAQIDRRLYRAAMNEAVHKINNLCLVFGEVTAFLMNTGRIAGVRLGDGVEITAKSVVLTTGTFLNGLIHIGDKRSHGGRIGDDSATVLAAQIQDLGLKTGRLKTGTPPRLDGRTINWKMLEQQPGDTDPAMFSFLSVSPVVKQVSCGITHTNPRTHEIIRANLDRSAMYGGMIEGIGPRYCPSIEDKVVRFSSKESHQIFLEPEGLEDSTVYPNGISTSLPADVQEEYVRSIAGLENALILQPGYAIEYDYMDPRGLNEDLAVRQIQGLYFAGQINGTTGYEEAAAQGLVAGFSAARAALDLEPLGFPRSQSYIGVMIDDLVTQGVSEPYRMFTSRAEYRLSLRADNADQRLTPMAIELSLVSEERREAFVRKMSQLDAAREVFAKTRVSSRELNNAGIRVNADGPRRSLLEALTLPGADIADLTTFLPELVGMEPSVLTQIKHDSLYHSYIDRQQRDIEALQRDEAIEIPEYFEYAALSGLSNELSAKLEKTRPKTLAQAGRIDGMTPAALTLIFAHIRKREQRRA
ncbi:MAG: tRNA uridine-5-carboxymethylaminomethyl(34) synthesis enzyme MnmG [Tropicimonas sp.]|uniref:tRNA uridine-5-carboxymethylaminomethyl(34) synthesis enzyme MnmG n=1 Tax=Tropicimonas sp. TaxID=2067044 RepID=UPI003A8A80DE